MCYLPCADSLLALLFSPEGQTSHRFHFNSGVSFRLALNWHGGVIIRDVSSEGLNALDCLSAQNSASQHNEHKLLYKQSASSPEFLQRPFSSDSSIPSRTPILAATTSKHATLCRSSRTSYLFISQWAHPDTRVGVWNSATWGLHLVS